MNKLFKVFLNVSLALGMILGVQGILVSTLRAQQLKEVIVHTTSYIPIKWKSKELVGVIEKGNLRVHLIAQKADHSDFLESLSVDVGDKKFNVDRESLSQMPNPFLDKIYLGFLNAPENESWAVTLFVYFGEASGSYGRDGVEWEDVHSSMEFTFFSDGRKIVEIDKVEETIKK